MLITIFLMAEVAACAQEAGNADTSALTQIRRPHILYAEVLGRGGYWSVGYGYSFFQRNRHELNSIIGANFMYYGRNHQSTVIPVGVFYRFGYRFKIEVGFTVTTAINWVRFYKESSWTSDSTEYIEIPNHGVGLIPSIGLVYASKSQKVELGLRYTPILNPQNIQNSAPVWFGAFFYYRLKQGKR